MPSRLGKLECQLEVERIGTGFGIMVLSSCFTRRFKPSLTWADQKKADSLSLIHVRDRMKS